MATARKPCDLDFNVSNNSRSFPTQAQSPSFALPSKSSREVGKQENIPLRYENVGNVSLGHKAKRVYYTGAPLPPPSHDDSSPYAWSWPESSLEKLLPRRLGLNRTGEGMFDQRRRNYIEKLASSLNLPQNSSTPFEGMARLGRDPPEPKSPCCGISSSPRMCHDTQSLWAHAKNHEGLGGRHELPFGRWLDGRGHENVTCTLRKQVNVDAIAMLEAEFFGWNVRQRALYQPTNNQHSVKEHRKKSSKNLRFCYNEAASKRAFTGRPDNQIHTVFFLKKVLSPGPCGSTSGAEIGGSNPLSQSVNDEVVAPNAVGVFSRKSIARWKGGPGRSKDWRSSRSLNSMRKGQQAEFRLSSSKHRSGLNPSKATSCYLAITHLPTHIEVPKDMLKQKSTFCQGYALCLKPKSTEQIMSQGGLNKKRKCLVKSSARCEPWMTDPIDSLDIEESWRSADKFNADPEVSDVRIDDLLNAMVSTHTEPSSPRFKTSNAKNISLNHLLAPESFVDTILGACLRLKRLLRTEQHYEVYDAEFLSDKNQRYGVRAYNLRGLSPKVRNSRIRNLKRASARSSYVDTVEQGGKKWLIFADNGADLVPEPFRDCDPLWYTREEYLSAFPALEPRRPYNPEKIEKEAFQNAITLDAYYTSFAEALQQELLKLGPWQALEVINRVRERLLASSKSWNNDDTVKPLSVQQKKIKSPEQAKRLRDRQRHSRQKTRMAKAALKLGANSDSLP